ncbi:MAG: hypothetical protein DRP54_05875 [Spirochaetes bacterium]|nr:MAG: hypothetical protein DRP54_05875 [Spirochaetota bacterium]
MGFSSQGGGNMENSVRFIRNVVLKSPIMVCTWPGMGNVAYGAGVYLKETVKAQKFAEIPGEDFFYKAGVQIKNGLVEVPQLPKSEFFYYHDVSSNRDLIIFIGESQPVIEKEYELASRVVEVGKRLGVVEIITFAATPANITHRVFPSVYGVSTSPEIVNRLGDFGVKVMKAGHIGGLNGLVLGVASEFGIPGTCFLGEIPFYTVKIENPKASLALLKIFMRYTGIFVDITGLAQMAQFVEEEIDRISTVAQKEISEEREEQDVEYEEQTEMESGPKKLPAEVRQRIEYMFELAANDISKAGELKKELDRWGVFNEYEDRFLDLFGRKNM